MKWSPHPKRESPHPTINKQTNDIALALSFAQQAQSIDNILRPPQPATKNNNSKSASTQYTLAKHLVAVQTSSKPSGKTNHNQSASQTVSANETTLSHENQEDQYLNYLKEYSTVIKSSKNKEQSSPQQQQEMDSLITEFLTANPNRQPTPTHKRKQSPGHSSSQAVKIQKIDLTHFKPTPQTKPHKKINKQPLQRPKQFTPIKIIQLPTQSPRQKPSKLTPRKQLPQIHTTISKPSAKQLQKLEVIKVQKINNNMNLKPNQHPQHQKNGYSNHHPQKERDSYLKKNLHKTIKTNPHPEPKDNKETSSNQPSPQLKKPIKIQIQIPLQEYEEPDPSRLQDYDLQSTMALEQQQTKIIKEISQKVLSLIQKTKNITPHKASPTI